jgi:hypothetical protein
MGVRLVMAMDSVKFARDRHALPFYAVGHP